MAAILALLPRRSSTAPAYRSVGRVPVVSAPPADVLDPSAGAAGSDQNSATDAWGYTAMSTGPRSKRARALRPIAIAVAIAVPVVSLPSLPHVSPWPALLGLAPWIVGKYVLCPLRWHALS